MQFHAQQVQRHEERKRHKNDVAQALAEAPVRIPVQIAFVGHRALQAIGFHGNPYRLAKRQQPEHIEVIVGEERMEEHPNAHEVGRPVEAVQP